MPYSKRDKKEVQSLKLWFQNSTARSATFNFTFFIGKLNSRQTLIYLFLNWIIVYICSRGTVKLWLYTTFNIQVASTDIISNSLLNLKVLYSFNFMLMIRLVNDKDLWWLVYRFTWLITVMRGVYVLKTFNEAAQAHVNIQVK